MNNYNDDRVKVGLFHTDGGGSQDRMEISMNEKGRSAGCQHGRDPSDQVKLQHRDYLSMNEER